MSTSFADLGVSRPVADALRSRGINSPFPVQQLVIEDVLDGRDVLVQSPTGSGKTLAFGVPIADSIRSDGPRQTALVLAPTRELAGQIVDELQSICHAKALKIAAVYGGVGIQPQIKQAAKAHIIVATPGRLEDLIDRNVVDLGKVEMLVLDEADRMLDMGFKPTVDRIVDQTPDDRQTLFFSATLEGATGKLADQYTHDPRSHVHAPEFDSVEAISHRFVLADSQGGKLEALLSELHEHERGRTLVFVRTKRGADRLVKKLDGRGVKALAIHGNKSQGQRQRALSGFERGDAMTLVATDVAARGIDVREITDVVNFDLPGDAETYTHRVGRTGRAGADGAALTLVLGDERADSRAIAKPLGLLDELNRAIGQGGGNGNGSAARGSNGNGRGSRNGNGNGRGHRSGNGRAAHQRNGNGGGNGGNGGQGRRRNRRRGGSGRKGQPSAQR